MVCSTPTLSCNTVQPDGLTGAILAWEGIADAAVILHGPTGCRGHHCSFSERAFPRDIPVERLNFLEPFYFGQPRIPTTYLDGDDFVFGAHKKLHKALIAVAAHKPALIGVINSPGTALIGEDLRRIAIQSEVSCHVATLDMPAISRSMAEGYEQAVLAVIETLALKPARVRHSRTVTLLGLSIAHNHWAGSLQELRRLLTMCGIEVVCAPAAGSPIAAWKRIPEAASHVVVHPEYGERLAGRLSDRFGGIPVIPSCGAPFGFDATEDWIKEVANAVGVDPTPALSYITSIRRRLACVLSRATTLTGTPKGLSYSIKADASTALPLTKFLYEYLGMFPASVETSNGGISTIPSTEHILETLTAIECAEAFQTPWQNVHADFLLADGSQVVQGPVFGIPVERAIELMLPMSGYLELVPKAFLGAEGAAYLVEKIVNAVPGML